MEQKKFLTCWLYYNCSEDSKKNCLTYKVGNLNEKFVDCSLYMLDDLEGGPEKHGPCKHCEWNKQYGPKSECLMVTKWD